jgi:hypothetical protein
MTSIRRFAWTASAAGIIAAATIALIVPDAAAQRPSGRPPLEEQAARNAAAHEPGRVHTTLARLAGRWRIEGATWDRGPHFPPSVTVGAATISVELGGRFVRVTSDLKIGGQPMQASAWLGWDTFRRQATTVVLTSHSTAVHSYAGDIDFTGTVFTQFGVIDNPATGQIGQMTRLTRRLTGDTQFSERLDLLVQGDVVLLQALTYSRTP